MMQPPIAALREELDHAMRYGDFRRVQRLHEMLAQAEREMYHGMPMRVAIPDRAMAMDNPGGRIPMQTHGMRETEIYLDPNTMTYRTNHQDRQLEDAKNKIREYEKKSAMEKIELLKKFDEQEKKKESDLDDLIAHYYSA